MADLQTITIADGSGDTVEQGITKLRDDLIKNANVFIDTSDPTTPPDGREWVRSDGANNGVKYAQINSVKTEVLYQYILNANLDFNDQEALNFLIEQLATGSISAASAGKRGALEYDTTQEKAVVIQTAARGYVATCDMGAATVVRIPCTLNVTGIGTPATNPSTSTILDDWWQLDAAAESLNVFANAPIPNGWTAANDLTLEVECLLLNAETANDTIDLDCTWRSLSDGDVYTKTATAATAASFDITSNTAQYSSHLVSITIDHDDATNPVAIDDRFEAIVTHDPTAGTPVAGIIVKAAWLNVPVFNYDA